MPEIELANMVMVEDKAAGRVLVLERVKSWKGLCFPGGHVEAGESIVDSAIREVKEETGLDVRGLQPCGIVHWHNKRTFDRYIVFLYRTSDFSGQMLAETDEGRVFWIEPDKIKHHALPSGFARYLPLFFSDDCHEAFGLWQEDEPWEIVYK